MQKNELFRKLPKVDKLINCGELKNFSRDVTHHIFVETIQNGIGYYRTLIEKNMILDFDEQDVIDKILELGGVAKKNSLRKVLNATGTIIHTNLGRSLLTKKVLENVLEISESYNNLEYNLETGSRGSRYDHLEDLICKITGAEAAVVVNNNAAAVILCLNEFGKNKETIISRGELVEIGGSFRIPDIMELSGTKLVEVGTTNRTHKIDYENVVTENSALILKVHASNYKIIGFTNSLSAKEIADLAKEKNLISYEDIGSGTLIDFSKYGVTKEPTVQESIEAGIDIVSFSGDKLLGGPQAGIIVGKKEYIEKLKKNQYLRAFRVNKMTIAALEIIFKYYLDEKEAIREIPTLKMITENPEEIYKKAVYLIEVAEDMLKFTGFEDKLNGFVSIVETEAKIGGGSMPEETVKSFGIAIEGNANELEEKFRKDVEEFPIIGRIYDGKFVLDLKTIDSDELYILANKICSILKEAK